jgi:hypothetical protein
VKKGIRSNSYKVSDCVELVKGLFLSWKRKKVYKGKNEKYSILEKLRKKNKSDTHFELMISKLTLEEVIAVKMELAGQSLGGRIYNWPIWDSLTDVVRHAILMFTMSVTKSNREAAQFLGVTEIKLRRNKLKYLEDKD